MDAYNDLDSNVFQRLKEFLIISNIEASFVESCNIFQVF